MKNSVKPKIGVSACLLGNPVRFDGGHRLNRFVVDECGEYFDLVSTCPEVRMGLGIPRPVIQLRKFDGEKRLVQSKNHSNDLTDQMTATSQQIADEFSHVNGFIFKKDSPSCGMERVAVYDNKSGAKTRNGVGIFAEQFMLQNPDIPTEEEGRLNDVKIRENFFERVYAHHRWNQIENPDTNLKAFRDFHRKYKLILMAKNTEKYRVLGRMVAQVTADNLAVTRRCYFSLFMQVMSRIATHGQHVNVLMHIMGYLKDRLSSDQKKEILNWFENYRNKQVQRITPLAILQHHFIQHPNEYMAEQYYFAPFPKDLLQPM